MSYTLKSSAVLRARPDTHSNEYAIFTAVEDGDAHRLDRALERVTPEVRREVLGALWNDFDGTMHYHALTQTLLMANMDAGNGKMAAWVMERATVVDYLRSIGAPCQTPDSENGVAAAFLNSDWNGRPSSHVVERLMRDALKAKHFDPNGRIGNQTPIEGLLPLDAAFHMGNATATRVLLEYGADLMAPLARTEATDIVEYARSFGEPGSDEVAAVVAEFLMTQRLAGAPSPSENEQKGARRRLGL